MDPPAQPVAPAPPVPGAGAALRPTENEPGRSTEDDPARSAAPRPAGSCYVGRFAPSPTGPLHAGSLVAAMASWGVARPAGGRWPLRIEDLDPPREVPGAARAIIDTLTALGMEPDEPVTWQSRHHEHYRQAFDALRAQGRIYPCGCTRREIADSQSAPSARHAELSYPGTCRNGLAPGRQPRAWRLRVGDARIRWRDRSGRAFDERLADTVGDFVLLRADGLWAYQLAVVVDDGRSGITDVVRGDDLIGSTARQILLHRLLGSPVPRHLHVPLVLDAAGDKLSKQTGAQAIDPRSALAELQRAATHLGLPAIGAVTVAAFWPAAIDAWRTRPGGMPAVG